MQLHERVLRGRFLRRYKRFFADIDVGGQVVVAHLPNTGSLLGCLQEGADCVITESDNPARKLKATLHFVRAGESWVGVNTTWPNHLVHEAWANAAIARWSHLGFARKEHRLNRETRLDLALAVDQNAYKLGRDLHHVEVKSVTYATGTTARFPDAVSVRAQKHLRELMRLRAEGLEAELVFVVQRQDCTTFAPADHIDPEYGRLLREAEARGVRIGAYACALDLERGELKLQPDALELRL